MNELKVKILDSKAALPRYMTSGAAAMDICARLDEKINLKPLERALIPTGFAIGLERGYAALLFARSGLAIKQGLCLSNGVGVIDSDYTGEIKVGVVNLGSCEIVIEDGMRVAQMMITKVESVVPVVCEKLEETGRGAGGFGSTGTK